MLFFSVRFSGPYKLKIREFVFKYKEFLEFKWQNVQAFKILVCLKYWSLGLKQYLTGIFDFTCFFLCILLPFYLPVVDGSEEYGNIFGRWIKQTFKPREM